MNFDAAIAYSYSGALLSCCADSVDVSDPLLVEPLALKLSILLNVVLGYTYCVFEGNAKNVVGSMVVPSC